MAQLLTRLAIGFAAVLIAVTAFLAAVVFLFEAVFLFFEGLTSPPLAALATTGVLTVFGVVTLLIGRGLSAAVRPKTPKLENAPHPLTGVLGRELSAIALTNPLLAIGAAMVIGIFVGFSPRLRGVAAEFLKTKR